MGRVKALEAMGACGLQARAPRLTAAQDLKSEIAATCCTFDLRSPNFSFGFRTDTQTDAHVVSAVDLLLNTKVNHPNRSDKG
jgi:hypothetical protein